MKKYLMALLAAVLIISFAGCTQYDYSLLGYYWQEQQSQAKKDAQDIASRTDLESLFTETFNGGAKITLYENDPYASTASALLSGRASSKVYFAVAEYDGFKGSGEGAIYGKMVYILQTSEDNGVIRVTSYSAYVPAGESLSVVIDGEEHELDISVSDNTSVSGTITKDSSGKLSASITISEMPESSVSVSVDGQKVDVSEEPSDVPVAEGKYTVMMNDMYTSMVSGMVLSGIVGLDDADSTEFPREIKDNVSGNVIATVTLVDGEPYYTIKNGGSYHVTETSTVTWEGSVETGAPDSADNMITFDGFRITGVTGSDVPAWLPKDFSYSKLDGKASGSFSESEMMAGLSSISFDGRTYGDDDIIPATFMFMVPMNLSQKSLYDNSTEGNLNEFSFGEGAPVFEGTWKLENGIISIPEGSVEAYGVSAEFAIQFDTDVPESLYNWASLSYTFSGDPINVDIINAIMNMQ